MTSGQPVRRQRGRYSTTNGYEEGSGGAIYDRAVAGYQVVIDGCSFGYNTATFTAGALRGLAPVGHRSAGDRHDLRHNRPWTAGHLLYGRGGVRVGLFDRCTFIDNARRYAGFYFDSNNLLTIRRSPSRQQLRQVGRGRVRADFDHEHVTISGVHSSTTGRGRRGAISGNFALHLDHGLLRQSQRRLRRAMSCSHDQPSYIYDSTSSPTGPRSGGRINFADTTANDAQA